MPPKRKLKFLIKVEFKDLERTTRGKWVCPACESTFWGEKATWERHRRERHLACICGRWFMATGLKQHQRKCAVFNARAA
jgi:hypothetical protein